MLTLANDARERFIGAQAARLRSAFPKETEPLDPAALRSFVADGFDRARSYDVTDEQDVELFLDCSFLLALDFDSSATFPWAGNTLNDTSLTGTQKMSLIHDHLLFRGA